MTALQEAAMRKAILLCEWIAETPHQRGSINGQAAQVEYALRTALAQQVERKNCPQPEICGSKECEFCRDTAAPAQQPVAYITDTEQGPMVWTPEMYDEACTYCDDGEFPVPLYTVEPAPQAQPMTDPCKTCSHFKKGNLPGVRIHDETCYECRSYWGNKWEAA